MRKKRQLGLLIVTVLSVCLLLIWGYLGADAEETAQPFPEQQSDQPPLNPVEGPRPCGPETEDYVPPPKPVLSDTVPAEQLSELQQLIENLRDDDIPDNAYEAMWKLATRLPDDKATVRILTETLDSDDWQQRQVAGYILSRWATHSDMSGNRRFLEVMVEALRDEKALGNMHGVTSAENYLCGHSGQAVDLLQNALMSDNQSQRIKAAFLLTVSLNIPPQSRERIKEILSDSSGWYIPDAYRMGAWSLCAIQDETSQHHQIGMIADHVYIVKPGDILGVIAGTYGTSVKMLAMYNCLENPDLIEPGMKIFIPGTLSPTTWETSCTTYDQPFITCESSEPSAYEHVLYPGETLDDVARQYNTTEEEIMILNGISDLDAVRPGTRLLIPFGP